MAKIHEDVQKKLEESNAKYKEAADVHRRVKVFKEGDLVWVYLKKERFLSGSYNKLIEKKVGPCQVLKKINDNSYEVELPPHIHTHPTFNVRDLLIYHAEQGEN